MAADKLKALQDKWYKKLAKSGFEDIEQPDGNLKIWSATIARARYRPGHSEAKEEYYRLAGQFLHEYPFKSKRDRHIWEMHANGVSIAKIAKFLKRKNYKIHSVRVAEIVKEFAATMKQAIWKKVATDQS